MLNADMDLNGLGVAELQRRVAGGDLTARALTEACLARIAALDGQVNAVIACRPDAMADAEALDRERGERGRRGVLHGLPVLIKDNIDTGGGLPTTAGSLALEGLTRRRDAFLVRRLRQAGAVVLGKTNLSEWANFRSRRSSSGWSSLGGQTRNPYAPERSPGGSSSGSAVAVALGFCAVAVGTETDGSIVSPAAMNGVVGIKPTVGLISRAGVVPVAASQDTPGPLARTVADAAALLTVLAGSDPDDPATAAADQRRADYTRGLDAGALRGARIGVARSYCGYHPAVDNVVEESLAALRDAGAEVVDDVPLRPAAEIRGPEIEVMLHELKAGLDAYLDGLGPDAPVRNLAELIDFNARHAERVMPYFGQDLFVDAEARGPLSAPRYREALETARRLARADGIDKALSAYRLDAIVAPTTSPAWTIDWINGDHRTGSSACLAAVAGYPSVTVPAGHVAGLPVGVSFFAGAFREARLIALAHAFEQATAVRRPPQLAAT